MEQKQEKKLIENRMFQSRLPDSAGFTMMFTPFIDVFFILLLFITFGAGVVYSKGLLISPPTADNAHYQHADKLVIALTSTEDNVQIYFNDRTVGDFNILENQLKTIIKTTAAKVVMLRADQSVPVNDIAQVMNICQKYNVGLFIITKSE